MTLRFYGYKHWTLEESPRCFYVGKGLCSRTHSHRSRNHKWHAVVRRFGLRVEICVGPVTNQEACAWEIEQIVREGTFSECHAHDAEDICCNFTRGGDGVEGYKHSFATLKRMSRSISLANRGRKHTVRSRLNMSNAHKKPVQQLSKADLHVVASYTSITEASMDTGACAQSIGLVCRGLLCSAGGFIWRYA